MPSTGEVDVRCSWRAVERRAVVVKRAVCSGVRVDATDDEVGRTGNISQAGHGEHRTLRVAQVGGGGARGKRGL